MRLSEFLAYCFRKVYIRLFASKRKFKQYVGYVELWNQEANDYCYNLLASGKPCMISKFGTIELSVLQQFRATKQEPSFTDYVEFIKCVKPGLQHLNNNCLMGLCSNAGFFPNNIKLTESFYNVYVDAMKKIDVLGSYIYGEKDFFEELKTAKKVNIEGYYYPFFFKKPWTQLLRGKKVLVVCPFDKEVVSQYKKRKLIWGGRSEEILPDFNLIVYKSVQSMLGIKTEYNTWFEALAKMEEDISKIDFDVALIGCGAYGMPLSAFVKSLGKQAIHLAACTQVLFGIRGKRWDDLNSVNKYMNEYWIRPYADNIPEEAKRIENGCYW